MDYYDTLLIKALGPLAIVAMFWMWPLGKAIQGKPSAEARGTAAKLSLFWLEVVLVSVSTTIMQCFPCDSIGGKYYLRAEVTLGCDGTRRKVHVAFASLMILLYPIGELKRLLISSLVVEKVIELQSRTAGVPLLLFRLMYPVRNDIKTLMQALKSHDAQASSIDSAMRRLSKKRSSIANLQVQLEWLIGKFKDYQPDCWCAFIYFLVAFFHFHWI